jgi:hypothetical protein
MPIYFVAHDRDKLLKFGDKGEHFFDYEEDFELKGVLQYLPKPIRTIIQCHMYATQPTLRRSLATRLAFAMENVHEDTKLVRVVASGIGTVILLNTLLSGMVKVFRPDIKFKLHLLDSPLNKGVLLNTLPNKTLKQNNVESVENINGLTKSHKFEKSYNTNNEYLMLLNSTAYSDYLRPRRVESLTDYIKYIKENYGS